MIIKESARHRLCSAESMTPSDWANQTTLASEQQRVGFMHQVSCRFSRKADRMDWNESDGVHSLNIRGSQDRQRNVRKTGSIKYFNADRNLTSIFQF
jgi:hypothetical protein